MNFQIQTFWGIIILFLGLADVFLNFYVWIDSRAIQRLVNITKDDGLPNWFSSIQLLAIAIVLWIIMFVLLYSKPNLIRKKTEKSRHKLISYELKKAFKDSKNFFFFNQDYLRK